MFDFFSYFLPAFVLVVGIYIAKENIPLSNLKMLSDKFSSFSVEFLFLLIPMCYLLGFILSYPSSFFYKSIEFVSSQSKYTRQSNDIVRPKNKEGKELKNSEMYILIREFTPNNFLYVEKWNIYMKMSIHLLFMLFSFLITLICIKESFNWKFFLLTFFISYFLIKVIREFNRWRIIECVNTIELFKLNVDTDENFKSKWEK